MEIDFREHFRTLHEQIFELSPLDLMSAKDLIECQLNKQVEKLFSTNILNFPEFTQSRNEILANDSANEFYFFLLTILRKQLNTFRKNMLFMNDCITKEKNKLSAQIFNDIQKPNNYKKWVNYFSLQKEESKKEEDNMETFLLCFQISKGILFAYRKWFCDVDIDNFFAYIDNFYKIKEKKIKVFINAIAYDSIFSFDLEILEDFFCLISQQEVLLKEIQLVSLIEKNAKNKNIFEAIEFIQKFIKISVEEKNGMLIGFCILNKKSIDGIEEVSKELMTLLPTEFVVFPILSSIYGKYATEQQMIALSEELDTKMANVFGIIHELCHKKRYFSDEYDYGKRTPEKMNKEAGEFNENFIFGEKIKNIIPSLKSSSFYGFAENLANWKPKFISNYLTQNKDVIESEIKEKNLNSKGNSQKKLINTKHNGCNFAAMIERHSLSVRKWLGINEDF